MGKPKSRAQQSTELLEPLPKGNDISFQILEFFSNSIQILIQRKILPLLEAMEAIQKTATMALPVQNIMLPSGK